MLESLISGLSELTKRYNILENNTKEPLIVQNFTVNPNSIAVIVSGAERKSVANVYFFNKKVL